MTKTELEKDFVGQAQLFQFELNRATAQDEHEFTQLVMLYERLAKSVYAVKDVSLIELARIREKEPFGEACYQTALRNLDVYNSGKPESAQEFLDAVIMRF